MFKTLGKRIFKWVGYIFCACTALGLAVYAIFMALEAAKSGTPLILILKAIIATGIAGFLAWNARQLLTDRFTSSDQERHFRKNTPPHFRKSTSLQKPTPQKPPPQKLAKKDLKPIIIDGNNVFLRGDPNTMPLHMMVKTLDTMGHFVHVFFDANIYYVMRNNDIMLSGRGNHHTQVAAAFGLPPDMITIVPAGSQADHFIIPHAQQNGGTIISNDRFKEFKETHPWLNTSGRLAKFDVINEQLSVPNLALNVSLR